MRSEEEIKEAIKAAEQREEGLEYSERGPAGGNEKLAIMCNANVAALKWVLEDEDGFICGLPGYKARQEE